MTTIPSGLWHPHIDRFPWVTFDFMIFT
jgi:hypothetical protein